MLVDLNSLNTGYYRIFLKINNALYWDNIYLEKNLKTDKRHFLYVDRGTETLDASYKPYHDQLLTTLSLAGYNTQNPRFLEAIVEGAGHDEIAGERQHHQYRQRRRLAGGLLGPSL